MAKILSLKLNYKETFLDYAKEGREIRKQFFIGSNKFLQWQILDPSFPDKHLFVKKVGDKLVMNIPSGAEFTCKKDGQDVDHAYLKQQNLLSGNQLVLDPTMSGELQLLKDWNVEFDFRVPYVAVLNEQQRGDVIASARRPDLLPVERFNRGIMLIAAILTVLFLIFFDLFLSKETYVEETVELRMAQIAQKVVPDIAPTDAAPEITPEAPVADAPQGTATTGQGGQASTGSSGISSLLGGSFDPNATQAPANYAIVTVVEGFAVTGSGGGRVSGIGGSGGGVTAGGTGTTFSSTQGPGVTTNIGAIAASGPATQGYSVAPVGGTGAYITGDARGVTVSGKSWEQSSRDIQIMQDFRSRNIATVTESSISKLDASTQARYTSLGQQVRDRQSQIEAAYRQAQMNQSMTFRINLFVAQNGNVISADVIPLGEYPAGFVSEVKRICESWKFNVQQEMNYQFRFTLRA